MRKSRTLLAGISLAVLALTGCSAITNLVEDTTNSLDSGTTDSGSAIASLNRYTDLVNSVHDQMNYLESDVSYFEGDIGSDYEPYFTCNFDLYDRESLETDTMNPTGLTDSEAADLVAQATAIFKNVDATEQLCKDLGKYVTAQDYKTDDYAKGKTYVADLYTQIDAYYDMHDALLATLDGYYETYDTWEVDLNDPTSVGIDNMDKDLELADGILTLIEDSASAGTFEKMAEVQADYDALVASVASHTGDNAPAIDSLYTYDYDAYYDTLDGTYLPTIKRALRDMEAQDADALTTDYYDVLDAYNSMVDSYNYFLDNTGY